jgi:hypothetical protein
VAYVDGSSQIVGLAVVTADGYRARTDTVLVTGSGDLTVSSWLRSFISTAQLVGQGFLTQSDKKGDVSVVGIGSLAIGHSVRVISASVRLLGASKVSISMPTPMVGYGNLAAFYVVDKVLPPLCLQTKPPMLRWGQDIQRGMLGIWLRDYKNCPISPFKVTYTLFMVTPSGQLSQVGPCERTPAKGALGEFYATGIAGDLGQPGLWSIRWTYQVSFNGPRYYESMQFNVFDAWLARVPDPNRICKKGWF